MSRAFAALAVAFLTLLLLPVASQAAFTANKDGTTVTISGDDAAETLTLTVVGNQLAHGRQTAGDGGFASDADWDSDDPDVQPLALDDTVDLTVTLSGGSDVLNPVFTSALKSFVADGGDGDDVLFGSTDGDDVRGGKGDDRISPGLGVDILAGGDGDDILVWNNGEGSDRVDGDGGLDTALVNGASAGEEYKIAANGDRVAFSRIAPGPFVLDLTSEFLVLNTLGGDDKLTVDGGPTEIIATGGAGNDAFSGGGGPDTLVGGPGDDSLIGNLGSDVLIGGSGNDVLQARDNVPDSIRCGDGNDSALLDPNNVELSTGCETIDQANAFAPPPLLGLSIASNLRLTPKGRVLTIPVECRKTRSPCPGQLDLVTTGKIRVGKARVAVEVGSAPFDVPVVTKSTLKLTLTRNFAALARKGAKTLKVTAVIRNTNGLVVRVPMTIKLPARRR